MFFVLFSCKKTQGTTSDTSETESQEITEKDISKIDYIEFLLDEKTETYTAQWVEYNQLQEVIDNIKSGDMSFLYNNKGVIDSTLVEFKQNIPEILNTPSVNARINAFETKMLKLESLSNLSTTSKQELLLVIEDFFVAFSNLNLQMNKKIEFDNQNILKP
jgi:hypothetical protein